MLRSSAAPKDGRCGDGEATWRLYTELRSSAAPKDGRCTACSTSILADHWVAILGRPEGRPLLEIVDVVATGTIVAILGRPEGRPLLGSDTH